MNIKRITAFAAALVLSAGVLTAVPQVTGENNGAVIAVSADEEDEYTEEGVFLFRYDSERGGWALVGVEYGSYEKLDIPEEVKGKKVVAIDMGEDIYDYDGDVSNKSSYLSIGEIKRLNIPDTVTYVGMCNIAFSGWDPVYYDSCFTYKGKTYESSERLDLYCDINGWKHSKSGFYYENDKKTGGVVIKTYDGGKENVRIPQKIGGKNVTAIGEHAFTNRFALTNNAFMQSVYIPDTVRSIGECAFYCDDYLEKVHLPKMLEEIGDYAFSDTSLKAVNIPEKCRSIGKNAFSSCGDLKKVVIPDSVAEIKEFAFSGCSELKRVVIPNKVTEIEENTFAWCENLEEVKIGKGVKTLRRSAFQGCHNLKKITIPKNVTKIESSVFWDCNDIVVTYKGKKYKYDELDEIYS